MAVLKEGTTIGNSCLVLYGMPVGIVLMNDSNTWVNDSTIPGWCAMPDFVDRFPQGKGPTDPNSCSDTSNNYKIIELDNIPKHYHTIAHTHTNICITVDSYSHYHNYATPASVYDEKAYTGPVTEGWCSTVTIPTTTSTYEYPPGYCSGTHGHSVNAYVMTYDGMGNWNENASPSPVSFEKRPAYRTVVFVRRYS